MNDLGKNTPGGFLPSEPGIEELLAKNGLLKGGWDGLNSSGAGEPLVTEQSEAAAELKWSYQKLFSSAAGQAVLEDLVNMTLRRAPVLPAGQVQSIEQQALYATERNGQNGIVVHILSMIVAGREANRPKKKAKR